MLSEVQDLREEGAELQAFLVPLEERDWTRLTPFKDWTVWDVVAHLHFSDRLGVLTLKSSDEFLAEARAIAQAMQQGQSLMDYTREKLGSLTASDLLQRWHHELLEMCSRLEGADPQHRIKWFGPDMGVRMFTTSRQMETWAHAQDLYDLFRVKRTYTNRIKNIAFIGVKTFGWTFSNRGLEVPPEAPYVRLTAPSGAIWEWNESSRDNRIEGPASDFCHVVTQGRNVLDTDLSVVGETAKRWMAIAQCFAGGPAEPPKPGERAWERC